MLKHQLVLPQPRSPQLCFKNKLTNLIVVGAAGQGPDGVGDVLGGEGWQAGAHMFGHSRQVGLRGALLQSSMGPQTVSLRHASRVQCTAWARG